MLVNLFDDTGAMVHEAEIKPYKENNVSSLPRVVVWNGKTFVKFSSWIPNYEECIPVSVK